MEKVSGNSFEDASYKVEREEALLGIRGQAPAIADALESLTREESDALDYTMNREGKAWRAFRAIEDVGGVLRTLEAWRIAEGDKKEEALKLIEALDG